MILGDNIASHVVTAERRFAILRYIYLDLWYESCNIRLWRYQLSDSHLRNVIQSINTSVYVS